MTDPNPRDPTLDDTATAPTRQTPPPTWATTSDTSPTTPQTQVSSPPLRAQAAPPPAWLPAGWSSSSDPGRGTADLPTWTPAGQSEAPVKRSRGRWLVAVLGTVLLVVGAVGLAVFAAGAKSNAAIGPTFLPATTPLYVEARLDLPGSQRDGVVNFLKRFPGFADPQAFDAKVDDILNKQITNISGGVIAYTTDIKPWFSGQLALGVLQIPDALTGTTPTWSGGSDATEMLGAQHVVIGVGVKDRAPLDALLLKARALGQGLTFTDSGYNGSTITTVGDANKPTAAYSISDTMVLISPNVDDLKAALDVRAGKSPSLGGEPTFAASFAQLPADRLGAVWVGPSVYSKVAPMLSGSGSGSGSDSGFGAFPGVNTALLECFTPKLGNVANGHAALAIVAAGDHVALEERTNLAAPVVRTSTDLAQHVPADTLAYIELPRLGGALNDVISCIRAAQPDAFNDPLLKQIEKALNAPLEDEFSFVGDVGISLGFDGSRLHWGLVGAVADQPTAEDRVSALISMARLAGAFGGAGISVSQQQVAGATVSTLTLSNIDGLAGAPIEPSFSVAVANGHVYVGGGDFAATSLTRTVADSLGGSTRFTSALTVAGSADAMTVYVDIDGIRQRIEGAGNLANDQNYKTNTQPFLLPLDRFVVTQAKDGDGSVSRELLFVK